MGDEGVDLHQRAGVQKELEALASGELAGAVLTLDTLFTSSQTGLGESLPELIELGIDDLLFFIAHLVELRLSGISLAPILSAIRAMAGTRVGGRSWL